MRRAREADVTDPSDSIAPEARPDHLGDELHPAVLEADARRFRSRLMAWDAAW